MNQLYLSRSALLGFENTLLTKRTETLFEEMLVSQLDAFSFCILSIQTQYIALHERVNKYMIPK